MTIDEHDVNEADDVGRQETATEPPPRRWRFTRRMTRYIAAAVAVAVAGGALAVYRISRDDAATSGGRAITAAELERTYGTRIDLVALTALGGLVQLRFTVLDAAKAEPLFHLAENMPALEAESSGASATLSPQAVRIRVMAKAVMKYLVVILMMKSPVADF